MRRTNFSLLCAIAAFFSCSVLTCAQSFDADKYYYVQFVSGQNVVTAMGDGSVCETHPVDPSRTDSQLWRITGGASSGYQFVSRSGLMLFANSTASLGTFSASSSAGSNVNFTIESSGTSGQFVVYPKGVSNVWMNQLEGIGVGHQVGLWQHKDDNCPVYIISEAEYNELNNPDPAISLIPRPSSIKRVAGTVPADTEVSYLTDTRLATEEYKLNISESGITVTTRPAKEGDKFNKGIINAQQTLRQLRLLSSDGTLPCVDIKDKPRFGYRGLMLDVARHFFDKETVKNLIDAMAVYHFSVLHWHLTDDQGWRIEIPEYPRLTEIGAVREASFCVPSSPTFYDDTEYGRGMFYTLDDLREVVSYAQERGIEIIPEYDLPGHNVAAVASYPELFACSKTPMEGSEFKVRVNGGISKDVLNVGKTEVMDFMKCVLGHLAEVFPSKYIHLGGDECPTNAWQNCPEVQALIQREGLGSVNDVQPWLLEQLGKWLETEYGKTVICWDELLSHWPATNTVKPVIMAWNSGNYTQQAANKGFKSIYVPYQKLYLDFMQELPENCYFDEPYYGGWSETNVNTLDEVYNANPTDATNSPDMVLGPQGNLWTETCTEVAEMHHCFFPRALALSEVAWSSADGRNYSNFLARMQNHARVLDKLGIGYAKHHFLIEKNDESERQRLLAEVKPGETGHPSQDAVDALRNADADGLADALAAFKSADVALPEAGKYYEIQSASTYYKAHYNGATIYKHSETARIHYTQQYNCDELWKFAPSATAGKYSVTNLVNKNLRVSGSSLFTVSKATVANSKYDYVPGVLNLVYGTMPFYANADGTVAHIKASNETKMISYPGSWRIVEVKDFTKYLQKVLDQLTLLQDKDVLSYGDALVVRGDVTKYEYDLYLQTQKTGKVPQELKDLVTGIDDMPADIVGAVNSVYDLNGRRINSTRSALPHGIYIINGKKVIR